MAGSEVACTAASSPAACALREALMHCSVMMVKVSISVADA